MHYPNRHAALSLVHIDKELAVKHALFPLVVGMVQTEIQVESMKHHLFSG